jgi:phage gpG-like protein
MSGNGITGDFAKLARLQAQLKELMTSDSRKRLSDVVGAAVVTRLQFGFRASESPYGAAWKPLQVRTGGKPLLDTGRLRSSLSYQPTSSRFVVGTSFVGAAVHEFGATIVPRRGRFLRFRGRSPRRTRHATDWIFARKVTIPARPFMPNAAQGIPEAWLKEMNAAGWRFFSRIMKG